MFLGFPAPIEPDLVGHDRENELVRFVIQDIFLSLSSFTQRWFLFIEGFLKIRTTVTVFFTDYSLKTIFLKPAQKDCKYLSYDLSGLMSLQSNIFSRFWSIRIICPLFYGWVNQKIREKQWWFYGISGWLLNTYNVNRARSARWWSIGHLLVDLIKYWNFGIRAYTIFCKVSFLTGQIQNALPSSYCEYARNVGRCMYWQTIHELLCLLSASSLPRDTFTKRSLLWCSSFRVSRNINIANATTSSPHTIQVQKVKTPS